MTYKKTPINWPKIRPDNRAKFNFGKMSQLRCCVHDHESKESEAAPLQNGQLTFSEVESSAEYSPDAAGLSASSL